MLRFAQRAGRGRPPRSAPGRSPTCCECPGVEAYIVCERSRERSHSACTCRSHHSSVHTLHAPAPRRPASGRRRSPPGCAARSTATGAGLKRREPGHLDAGHLDVGRSQGLVSVTASGWGRSVGAAADQYVAVEPTPTARRVAAHRASSAADQIPRGPVRASRGSNTAAPARARTALRSAHLLQCARFARTRSHPTVGEPAAAGGSRAAAFPGCGSAPMGQPQGLGRGADRDRQLRRGGRGCRRRAARLLGGAVNLPSVAVWAAFGAAPGDVAARAAAPLQHRDGPAGRLALAPDDQW